MHLLAERNNEALARELQTHKDKLQAIMEEMMLADSDKVRKLAQCLAGSNFFTLRYPVLGRKKPFFKKSKI